jgi:hypothetical protein
VKVRINDARVEGWTDYNEHDPGVTVLELLVSSVAGFLFALGVYAYVRRRDSHRHWPP